MSSIKESSLGLNYGLSYGETGWNSGMDENIVLTGFHANKQIKGILSTPPTTGVSNGDAYIVGSSPTGTWVGNYARVAIYDRGSWLFATPSTGVSVYNKANGCWYEYNNGWSLKPEAEESPYIKVKDFDFSTGYTITDSRQLLFYPTSQTYYQWNGTLPKVVAAGATPATSGGIGAGAWVDRTDVTLRSDLASESGSELVGYQPAGTGAGATTVQSKLRESVSVFDFMTAAQIADVRAGTASIDVTTAFTAAQTASKTVYAPPGTYLLDGLRIQNNRNIIGAGYEATIFKQKNAGTYAINCLSDASVGQLLGVAIKQVGFIGAASPTVAVLNVEANGVFAITRSEFDFIARDTYSPLRIYCPDAANVYNCKFKVTSDRSATGIRSQGAYNEYDFFITNVDNSLYVYDISSSSTFQKVVTEGTAHFSGQWNTINLFTCENYPKPAHSLGTVLRIDGNSQTFSDVQIITVPNAKASSGLDIYGTHTTIGSVSIIGTPTTTTPNYPAFLSSTSSGSIGSFRSSAPKKIDAYTNGATMRKWTFGSDVSQALNSPVTRGGRLVQVNNFATSGSTQTFGQNPTVNDWYDAFVLNVGSTLATLTITIPQAPADGQVARFAAIGAGGVTALTLTPGAGHSVVGAPAGLAAGSSFELVFKSSDSKWYRF